MLAMEQVAALLASKGHGTLGQSIFVHRMPAITKAGLLILNRMEGEEIDDSMGSYRRGTLQLVCRAATFLDAEKKIRAAMPAITLRGWQDLPAAGAALTPTPVLLIRPVNEPVIYPLSDGDLVEASVDFEFCCA